MNIPSIAHPGGYGRAPGAAGLLPPMRRDARTSLPLILRSGWLAEPLADMDWDALSRKWDSPPGVHIASMPGFCEMDQGRVKALIEESFGKKLIEGYLGLPASCVYLAGDYEGIAVVKRLRGFDYLDKLAVAPRARGAGIGRGIWENIKKDFQSLIWRAAPDNPANAWYCRNSDGMVHAGTWVVYWYGIDAGRANALVPLVASLPATLIDERQDRTRVKT